MFGKTIPITHKALKCLPNTFSEYDEKIARLEKENKSLKAQIEECKGIKRRHRKRKQKKAKFKIHKQKNGMYFLGKKPIEDFFVLL